MTLNAKLIVVGGEVKNKEIKLRTLPVTLGRGRSSTIVLPLALISRQHCEISEREGRLYVRDLGSLNGTFINNSRITEAALAPGALLTIGTCTFRADYELVGAAAQMVNVPPPAKEETVFAHPKTAQYAPDKTVPDPVWPPSTTENASADTDDVANYVSEDTTPEIGDAQPPAVQAAPAALPMAIPLPPPPKAVVPAPMFVPQAAPVIAAPVISMPVAAMPVAAPVAFPVPTRPVAVPVPPPMAMPLAAQTKAVVKVVAQTVGNKPDSEFDPVGDDKAYEELKKTPARPGIERAAAPTPPPVTEDDDDFNDFLKGLKTK